MYTRRKIETHVVLYFVKWHLLWFFTLASLVYMGYELAGLECLAIPFLPIATIGTAVAFYVGFKNHASYERLWEARKIWGAITNISRSWGTSVISLVGRKSESMQSVRRQLIYRHIAWMNVLRLQLRAGETCQGDTVKFLPQRDVVAKYYNTDHGVDSIEAVFDRFVDQSEHDIISGGGNLANKLLCTQMKRITELKDEAAIDGFEHSNLQQLLYACFDEQGKSERIKNFPFPRQYAYFSLLFVHIFTILLPFGLIGEMAKLGHGMTWLTIPFSILISWIFITMEQVGDASEDPFEGSINDVPLSAMCRNIEIDLKRLLEEEELPEPIKPVNNILL